MRPGPRSRFIWPGTTSTCSPTFLLTIDVVQGNDQAVSGLLGGPPPASTPVTIYVTYAKAMIAGHD